MVEILQNGFIGGAISGGIQGGLGIRPVGTIVGGIANGLGTFVTEGLDRIDGYNHKIWPDWRR